MKYPQPPIASKKLLRLTTLVGTMTASAMLSACGGGSGGDSGADKSIAAIAPSGDASGSKAATQSASEPVQQAASAAETSASASAPGTDNAASGPSAQALAAKTLNTGTPIADTPTQLASAAKTSTPSPTNTTAAPNATITNKAAPATPIPEAAPAAATTAAVAPKFVATAPSVAPPSPEPLAAVPTSPMAAPTATSVTDTGKNSPTKATTAPTTAFTSNCPAALQTDFIDTISWTYRRLLPADCQTINISTPVFVWPQPENRDRSKPWNIVVKRATGEAVFTRNSTTPRIYLHDLPLTPGTYQWQVTFTDNLGKPQTSGWRRFNISPQAVGVLLPSGANVAAKAAQKPSPRLIPAGSTYASLGKLASTGEYAAAYMEYNAQAAREFSSTSPSLSRLPRSIQPTNGQYTNASVASVRALQDAASADASAFEILAISSNFTGKSEYEQAAKARLLALAAVPTRGDSSEANADQANRVIYVALAKGLDYLGPKLSPIERATVADALKDRIAQVMANVGSLDGVPYDSHQLASLHHLIQALMLCSGRSELPEARAWLETAWELWVTTMGSWAGSDGGYGNGNTYAWYDFSTLPQTLATARLISGVDLSKWDPVKRAGEFFMAFTPANTNLRNSFGDGTETPQMYDAYSFDNFRLYAALMGQASYEWYWRAKPSNINRSSTISPLHFFLLGAGLTKATPVAPTQLASEFRDAGLVAIHSSATSPNRSSLYFKSSRMGSLNHSHADQNSFNFVSQGRDILISGGYYPYFASPHHLAVTRATRFKNALTFDGGIGQAEPTNDPTKPGNPVFSSDPRGELINFQSFGDWTTATGDATLAYRGKNSTTQGWSPLLSASVRTISYNSKAKLLLIYDWATSATSRKWELNFNAPNEFTKIGSTIKIVNSPASVCIENFGPPGSFALSSGFPVAPEASQPTQYQARLNFTSASKELASLTVVREDCNSIPVKVSFAGSAATIQVNNTSNTLTFDKRVTAISP